MVKSGILGGMPGTAKNGLTGEPGAWLEKLGFLSDAMESTSQPFAVGCPDGRLVLCNDAYCDLTGYTKEELLKNVIWSRDLTPPGWREYQADVIRELRRTGRPQRFEKEYVHKNGTRFPVEVLVHQALDTGGNVLFYYSFFTDVTERKRAEKALKVSKERLNAILDGSPIPQFVIDKGHRVVYWNKAVEKYSGIRAEDVIGTDGHWKAFYTEKRPCMADLLVDEKEGEFPRWYDGEYRESTLVEGAYEGTDFFPRLGESGVWLYFTVKAIRGPGGSIIGAVETLEDITSRKRAELNLRSAKAQAELYLDLMCHDIDNLNQMGHGFLELALDMLNLDEGGHAIISESMGALESSSQLIDKVRKLQKVQTGQLKAEAVDLDKVLSGLRAQYSHVPRKDVTINYAHDPGCVVLADGLIRDLFSNLIWNAIKHSGGAPVHINLVLKRQREDGKEYCRVTVEDDGPGIPDEHKDKIFARFRRGATKESGKGLGLYLVKMLAEGYHGKVWAEDRVKGDHTKGARFVVVLPAAGQ